MGTGLGADRRHQRSGDIDPVEHHCRQLQAAHVGRVDAERGSPRGKEGTAVPRQPLAGVGLGIVEIDPDYIGRDRAGEREPVAGTGQVVGRAGTQVTGGQQVEASGRRRSAAVDDKCIGSSRRSTLVACAVEKAGEKRIGALRQRERVGQDQVDAAGAEVDAGHGHGVEQGTAVVQAQLIARHRIGGQRNPQCRRAVRGDAITAAHRAGATRRRVAFGQQFHHTGALGSIGFDNDGQRLRYRTEGAAGTRVVGECPNHACTATQADGDGELARAGVGDCGRA